MKSASKTLGTIAGLLIASHLAFADSKASVSSNVKETKVVPGYVKSSDSQSSASKEIPGYSGKKTGLQSSESKGSHGWHNANQP